MHRAARAEEMRAGDAANAADEEQRQHDMAQFRRRTDQGRDDKAHAITTRSTLDSLARRAMRASSHASETKARTRMTMSKGLQPSPKQRPSRGAAAASAMRRTGGSAHGWSGPSPGRGLSWQAGSCDAGSVERRQPTRRPHEMPARRMDSPAPFNSARGLRGVLCPPGD